MTIQDIKQQFESIDYQRRNVPTATKQYFDSEVSIVTSFIDALAEGSVSAGDTKEMAKEISNSLHYLK